MIKNKKLSYLLYACMIVIFFIVLTIKFETHEKVTVSYTDELNLETMETIKICIKENDDYKMVEYLIKDYNHIVNLYLGKSKEIYDSQYIPDNYVLDVDGVKEINNNIIIKTSSYIDDFNTEAFNMMRVTFKYLGFNDVIIDNGNAFTL